MDDPAQLTAFGKIFIIGLMGILLVLFTLFLGKVISPKNPTPDKLSTYECGEEAQGNAWIAFNPRFYVIALVFLLFDVELIFIFPWATVFGQSELIAMDARWGWFTLVEMAIFVGILVVGLVYVWRKGDLEWIKPQTVIPSVAVNIPSSAYDRINKRDYPIRKFEAALISDEGPKPTAEAKRPAFKPMFRKPGAAQ